MYSQGYANTSVNQVIDEASTHKASFYRYFETKEDLGKKVLKEQGDDFRNGWQRLMDKSSTPQEFIERWVALLLKQVRSGNFFGCPLSRFMGSVDSKESGWTDLSQEVLSSWILCLENYFDHCKQKGLLTDSFDSGKKAAFFMKLFQGNSQLYRMTANTVYFIEMKEEMLATLMATSI